MVLAVDIGNTTIVIGVLDRGKIKTSWHLLADGHRLADEYAVQVCELLRINDIPRDGFEGIVISSVVPPAFREFAAMCERYFAVTPIVVSSKEELGIELRCDYPQEVGQIALQHLLQHIMSMAVP